MLVYTKIVDGVRKLYGTMGRIPSENDEELVYIDRDIEDESEEVVEPVENDKYFATKEYTIQRASTDRKKYFDVYVVDKEHDEELVNIIPGGREASAKKELVKIEVNADDVKKDYDINEGLDLTGINVTATFRDTESGEESTKDVSDKITSVPAKGEKFSEEGTQTVTITYKDKTDSFEVNVVDKSKVIIYWGLKQEKPESCSELDFERVNKADIEAEQMISRFGIPDNDFACMGYPKSLGKLTKVYVDDQSTFPLEYEEIDDGDNYLIVLAQSTEPEGYTWHFCL